MNTAIEQAWASCAQQSLKKASLERWWKIWRWPHRVWHWCKQPTIRSKSAYYDKGYPKVNRRPGRPEKDQPIREEEALIPTPWNSEEHPLDALMMNYRPGQALYPAEPDCIPTGHGKYPTILPDKF